MTWSGDFKRRRMEEVNRMKIKDYMNYAMTSEYQYILNGIADPTSTHYFSDKSKDGETGKIHRRRYARKHGFLQTEMNPKLTKSSKMISRDGFLPNHPEKQPNLAYDDGDDDWKFVANDGKKKEAEETPQESLSRFTERTKQINVSKRATADLQRSFAESFRQFLSLQLCPAVESM